MGGLRRALVVLFGLAVAIGAALLFLPVAAMLDPTLRRASLVFAGFVIEALSQAAIDPESAYVAAELSRFVWTAALAVCVVPLIVVVAIGETARTRSALWYVGATALGAAAAPWVARAALRSSRLASASLEELRLAFAFFITGLVAGGVYWLIAGRARREGGPPEP